MKINTPAIYTAKRFIIDDKINELKLLVLNVPDIFEHLYIVPRGTREEIGILNRNIIGMKTVSILQLSIIYGSRNCFNYIINKCEVDHIDKGQTSLHLAVIRGEEYYIDQLLKKWGDNEIWINLRSDRMKYTALASILSIEEGEYIDEVFNEGDRTLDEVLKLKKNITERFMGYRTVNLLLQDITGLCIFDFLENTETDNDIKNILGTHPSMGEYQNIGFGPGNRITSLLFE